MGSDDGQSALSEPPDGPAVVAEAERLTIGWGEPSWLGPGSPRGGASASVHRPSGSPGLAIVSLAVPAGERERRLFADPGLGWSFDPAARAPGDAPPALQALGFQYTEFALPVGAGPGLDDFTLLPWRPPVVMPLLLMAGGPGDPDSRVLLLGPANHFHDQVLVVPHDHDGGRSDQIVWGLHGDVTHVDKPLDLDLAVIAAASPRAALDTYGAYLLERHGTRRPGRYRDRLGSELSYWTDNGASYWYKTEPPRDVPTTLAETVEHLRADDVPVGIVQLDSWFYPHEVIRPFDTDEWEVPPTGLIDWAARNDILPEGVAALRERLGNPPLATHIRHLSSQSPAATEHGAWVDGERAHAPPALYEEWLDRAESWGVEVFEHDWLIECYLGVHQLRASPGRALEWQRHLDEAAGRRGLTMQWCMASCADFLATVHLDHVTSIRTSGDHGYLIGPGALWAWFLFTNALARPLGLWPYKDVFHTGGDRGRHGEVEAVLSCLSGGPVGIGDRLGQTDADMVRRACRADGRIVKPDVPIALTDAGFATHPLRARGLLSGETHSGHQIGRVSYVVTINPADDGEPLAGAVPLPGPGIATLDWRTGEVRGPDDLDHGLEITLPALGWDYRIAAPVWKGLAVFGDPRLMVPAGDARLRDLAPTPSGTACTVIGPGETVQITGWAAGPVAASAAGASQADSNDAGADVAVSQDGNRWTATIEVGDLPRRVEFTVR